MAQYRFIRCNSTLLTDEGVSVSLGALFNISPNFHTPELYANVVLTNYIGQSQFIEDYAPAQFVNNSSLKQVVGSVMFTFTQEQADNPGELGEITYPKTIEALATVFGKQVSDFDVVIIEKP